MNIANTDCNRDGLSVATVPDTLGKKYTENVSRSQGFSEDHPLSSMCA